MTLKRAALSVTLAIALGFEIICPGGGDDPHVEKDVIVEPETVGSKADALRPVVTPPENPSLMNFTLRVTSPKELEGWSGEYNEFNRLRHDHRTGNANLPARLGSTKPGVYLRNMNLAPGTEGYEHTARIYLNEDYCLSWRNRKMCEQIQVWLAQRGVPLSFYSKWARRNTRTAKRSCRTTRQSVATPMA